MARFEIKMEILFDRASTETTAHLPFVPNTPKSYRNPECGLSVRVCQGFLAEIMFQVGETEKRHSLSEGALRRERLGVA